MKSVSHENEIKDVTIDELAGIINRSFMAVQDRLDDMVTKTEFNGFKDGTETALYELDRHAKITNERLDGIDTSLDGVEVRLGAVEVRLESVENRLGTVERKVDVIGMEIMGMA